MKYVGKDFNTNKIFYGRYAKNNEHNMNIATFLKCNYKYKRRYLRHNISNKRTIQKKFFQRIQILNKNQKQKYNHKLPAEKKIMMDDKQSVKRISFFKNTELEIFLRIFILIMQQAKLTSNKNKKGSNGLATEMQIVAKINTTKYANVLLSSVKINEDGIIKNHRTYKDANQDTNIDIISIADDRSHQQHNYDKVSTIISTPINCQRRNHHYISEIKTSISSVSSSSYSTPLLTPLTSSTNLLSPLLSPLSIVVQANYKTNQWSAILHNYIYDNSSINHHHQYQYHHKHKHNQHHYLQHLQQKQQYVLRMKSLTSSSVLNDNNNNSNNSINSHSRSNSKSTMASPACSRLAIYQTTDQYVNATWNRSCNLSFLLLTLFIAFTIGVHTTAAGACWQTVLDNGKCNEIFSLNISKSECCGANQEFAYTEREPTNVEYFFATAIGGGMECSPCLESCKNVKCGPNKKCVKRRGRPKCICAPECGAARRKNKQRENLLQQQEIAEQQQDKQRHTLHLISSNVKGVDDNDNIAAISMRSSNGFKIKIDKSQQSRDTRSLSSEIRNINLGLETGKDGMKISDVSVMLQMERHHSKENNQNQRKLIHIHMQHSLPQKHQEQNNQQQKQYIIRTKLEEQRQEQKQPKYKNQEPESSQKHLITANVENMEKPTTRRLQIFSNVRTTHVRRHYSKKRNNKNNNSNRNKHDQYRNSDPLDSNEENYEEFNYNHTEDNDDEEAKKNYINRNINGNNSNSNNNNNRNHDTTRFMNQSPSRRNLKTNIKPNDTSGNNKKIIIKKKHTLQTTEIQQHSSNEKTCIKHSHQSGHHVENSPHGRHHHQNHQNNNNDHNHHRQQHQRHRNQHNHQQQNHHGRQKHNKQQQSIVLKKPKNNKNYNTTITVVSPTITTNITSPIPPLHNSSNLTTSIESFTTLLQSRIINTATVTITPLNLSSYPSATAITTIPNQQTQPKLLFSSSAISSLTSATPVNSTMSADNSEAATNDHYHSYSPNHGSKIATSPLPSPSPQLPSSPFSLYSSESAFLPVSAKGEGVSLHHNQHRRFEMPTFKNNNNTNNHTISTLNINLHNNKQKEQQQEHQPQVHQQYFQSPLFDGISDQTDVMEFPNKQYQQHIIMSANNVRPLNPVCATDGRTYNTECQLRKRACRIDNPDLHVAYRGHCRTTCNGVKCLNGLTCVEDQYSMPHCIACKIECPQDNYDNDVVDATKAVCGADGKTYKSACDINRMICKIGRSIGVAYPGPCREEEITCDDIKCGSKQVCLIDLLTHKPRCTSCRYKCSRKRRPLFHHIQEGKICGANNHTYNSWCEMRKDSCSTGFYIDLKYSGDCH